MKWIEAERLADVALAMEQTGRAMTRLSGVGAAMARLGEAAKRAADAFTGFAAEVRWAEYAHATGRSALSDALRPRTVCDLLEQFGGTNGRS